MPRKARTIKAKSWGVSDTLSLLGLLVLSGILFLPFLGNRGLWEIEEARYAEVAREMATTHDWLTPRLNYVPYFKRPPLTYWLTALSFNLGGVSETSARLVPAVFGTLTVLLTFIWGRSMGDWRSGTMAGLILATSIWFFTFSRILQADILLCFAVNLALFAVWEMRKGRAWSLYVFWLGLAVGFMAGGLPALVFPGVVLGAYCLLAGELSLFRRLCHWRGLLLFILLSAPWLIWVGATNTGFFPFFFGQGGGSGFFSAGYGAGAPFYYYFWTIPLGFFPWVILIPWAVVRQLPAGDWRHPSQMTWLWFMVWMSSFLVLLTLSPSKSMEYTLLMLPGLALLLAPPLASLWDNKRREPDQRLLGYSLLVLALSLLLGAVVIFLAPSLGLGLGFQQMGALLIIAPAVLAGLGLWVALFRKRPGAALAAPLLVFLVLALGGVLTASRLEEGRSLKKIMAIVQAHLRKNDYWACYNNFFPGAAFYSARRMVVVNNWGDLDFGRRRDAEASKWFVADDRSFLKILQSPKQRVVGLSKAQDYVKLKEKAQGIPGLLLFEWARIKETVLFSNRPR